MVLNGSRQFNYYLNEYYYRNSKMCKPVTALETKMLLYIPAIWIVVLRKLKIKRLDVDSDTHAVLMRKMAMSSKKK